MLKTFQLVHGYEPRYEPRYEPPRRHAGLGGARIDFAAKNKGAFGGKHVAQKRCCSLWSKNAALDEGP